MSKPTTRENDYQFMSNLYRQETPEDQSSSNSTRAAIERAKARHAAAQVEEQAAAQAEEQARTKIEPAREPDKGGRPPGSKNKWKRPQIDHKALEAQIADAGHLYSRPALIVVQCPSLSPMAKALYWWLDARCFDGNKTQPARADIIVGQDEITEALGIERKAITRFTKELREHGFVYREGRGHLKYHRYRLPLREKRILFDAELKAKRSAL